MESNQTFPLLLLPPLVFDSIVQFLDVTSIKRLRLVSSEIKTILESPQSIKCLTVKLQDEPRLVELLNFGGTFWNNFHLVVSDQFPSKNILNHWTKVFGGTTKRLCISKFTNTLSSQYFADVVQNIILKCNSLEYFEVEELDFTKINYNHWQIILKQLKSLQELHLQRVVFISDKTKYYFSDILKSCSNLRFITLPRLQSSLNLISSNPVTFRRNDDRVEIQETTLINEYANYFVDPIIQKIKEGSLLKLIHCPEELLSVESFFRLAEACTSANITINYSEPSYIPSLILYLPENKIFVSECIGSISGINEKILSQPFSNLKRLQVSNSNFLCKSEELFQIPTFSRLEFISLHFSTWSAHERDKESLRKLSAFIFSLGNCNRPSVRSIYISSFLQKEGWVCPHANLVRPYLLQSCTNLTTLHLDSVQYMPQEYLALWSSLIKLQKVRLMRCLGFNDESVTGRENCPSDSMLLLSNLTELRLNEVGQVTIRSYMAVFSNMKLTTFHHNPSLDYPVDSAAFRYVVQGPVWAYLEMFESSGIGFRNYKEKSKFACRYKISSSLYDLEQLLLQTEYECEKASEKIKNNCLCC